MVPESGLPFFFKGCNLKCPWCANPENISFEVEYGREGLRQEKIYGCYYSEEMLYEELMKDEKFWSNTGGGITFSGGEPLLHLYRIQGMLEKLKKRYIHLAVETALQVPPKYLTRILTWIDYYIVDIKVLDRKLCRTVLHGNLDGYFDNLRILGSEGKEILFRIPCNMEYTATHENLERICRLLCEFPDVPVEIFSIHNMGRTKYESLGKAYREFERISGIQLEGIKNKLEQCTDAPVVIRHI